MSSLVSVRVHSHEGLPRPWSGERRPKGGPRRLIRWLAALLVVGVSTFVSLPGMTLAGTATEPPGSHWHLDGKVTGQDGRGLAGLTVCAQTPAVDWYCNDTASDGSYRISLPSSPADYLLFVGPNINADPSATYSGGCYNTSEPGNLAPEFTPGSPLPAGGDCSMLSITTPDTSGIDVVEPFVRTLRGHVSGADGGPLAGVSVRDVSRWGWGVGTTTASDGSYSLRLAEGTSYVIVFSPSPGQGGCYLTGAVGNLDIEMTNNPLTSHCTLVTMGGIDVGGIDVTIGATATPTPSPTSLATTAPSVPIVAVTTTCAEAGQGGSVSFSGGLEGWVFSVFGPAPARDWAGSWNSDASGGGTASPLAVGTYLYAYGPPGTTATGEGTLTITACGATPSGTNVVVSPAVSGGSVSGIQVTFADVSAAGTTSVAVSNAGPPVSGDFVSLASSPTYYDVSTTATHSGSITLCLPYDRTAYPDPNLVRLLHWNGTSWEDVTSSVDSSTATVCGTTTSLSPFIVGQRRSGQASGAASSTGVPTSEGLLVGFAIAVVLVLAVVAGWWLMGRRREHAARP